jgi:hypothetical protein
MARHSNHLIPSSPHPSKVLPLPSPKAITQWRTPTKPRSHHPQINNTSPKRPIRTPTPNRNISINISSSNNINIIKLVGLLNNSSLVAPISYHRDMSLHHRHLVPRLLETQHPIRPVRGLSQAGRAVTPRGGVIVGRDSNRSNNSRDRAIHGPG